MHDNSSSLRGIIEIIFNMILHKYSYHDNNFSKIANYMYNLWIQGKKANRTSYILYIFPHLIHTDYPYIGMFMDIAINAADNIADEFHSMNNEDLIFNLFALSIALENLEKNA